MNKWLVASLCLFPFATLAAEQKTDLVVGMAVDQQLSVVIELNQQYRGVIGNDGLALDYLAKKGTFNQDIPVTWYVGVGGWAEWNDDFGFRVPLGLNWDLTHGWDLYGQIQPELSLYKGAELQLGGAVGIKYQF
ncbi:TPA: hypothetical protein I7158_01210 [Vibrio vulnificus]|nr:hypothetical protein [Vibrio vulnificus]HAU8258287.1 hypothetical protein [Vibrio vulnificus]